MKITAITKYKHGELFAILRRLEWSQAELARRSGINPSTLGQIINLVRRPSVKQVDAIQQTLATAGQYIDVLAEWPATFAGIPAGYQQEQTAEVQLERLLDHPEVLEIAAPEPNEVWLEDGAEHVLPLMETLSGRGHFVLRKRYLETKTLEEVGKQLGVTREGVRYLEAKALRELRARVSLRNECGV